MEKDENNFQEAVGRLVLMSLTIHNLNKVAESKLGLSLVQYHLLRILRDMPGSSPQRLAFAVGMHPSTLTQSMKRLVRKDLIFVEEDPKDSRKKILGLTTRGSTALQRFEGGINSLLKQGVEQKQILSRLEPIWSLPKILTEL
ncbi:MAG: MarR family transcriptional regulator [Oligoflexia bacterium]|nr:MarR family transcriptional regulator [Oligoflexia bacterium]